MEAAHNLCPSSCEPFDCLRRNQGLKRRRLSPSLGSGRLGAPSAVWKGMFNLARGHGATVFGRWPWPGAISMPRSWWGATTKQCAVGRQLGGFMAIRVQPRC